MTQAQPRASEHVTRILGLDVGDRRIGIAISSPNGGLAVPLRILERVSDDADVEAIAELVREERADALVVGHPISMDGKVGAQARRVEAFARRLAGVCDLPLELVDERLTSAQVQRLPAPAPRKRSRRRAHDDDLAAAVILQSYLDRQR